MNQDNLYSDRAHRLDALAGPENAAYWKILVRLSDAWDGPKDSVFGLPKQWPMFADWCAHYHGFRPEFDDTGNITGNPRVINEQKYTLCLLKYSG